MNTNAFLKTTIHLILIWALHCTITSNKLSAQQWYLTSDMAAHLRPFPTANMEISRLSKNRKIEYKFGLEKMYASFRGKNENIIQFSKDHLNLDYLIGVHFHFKHAKKSRLHFGTGLELRQSSKKWNIKDFDTQEKFLFKSHGEPTGYFTLKTVNFDQTGIYPFVSLTRTTSKQWKIHMVLGFTVNYFYNIQEEVTGTEKVNEKYLSRYDANRSWYVPSYRNLGPWNDDMFDSMTEELKIDISPKLQVKLSIPLFFI